jgi:hypothetical protein
MNIQELKAKKSSLESDILNLLLAFQEETAASIKAIEVIKLDTSTVHGQSSITVIETTIQL